MLTKILHIFQDKKDRWLLAAFILLGLFLIFGPVTKAPEVPKLATDPTTADTIIPPGFVLVPVEIQNIETIGSMVGEFGVVDLFTTSQPTQKGGLRVARRIRLLRAPLNPQTYAVLVPESEAHELLSAQGPFTAVIQNPENKNPTEVIKQKITRTSVHYFKGGSLGH